LKIPASSMVPMQTSLGDEVGGYGRIFKVDEKAYY